MTYLKDAVLVTRISPGTVFVRAGLAGLGQDRYSIAVSGVWIRGDVIWMRCVYKGMYRGSIGAMEGFFTIVR